MKKAKKVTKKASAVVKKAARKISKKTIASSKKKPSSKTDAEKKALRHANKPEEVDAFMEKLDHPFRAEVQAVRDIIKSVNRNITEQIKWNAPSFSYKEYMVTFNLWAKQHVHLVFHNGAILQDTSGLLEGDYVDRRMMYFSSMADIDAKKAALIKIIKAWVRIMDR